RHQDRRPFPHEPHGRIQAPAHIGGGGAGCGEKRGAGKTVPPSVGTPSRAEGVALPFRRVLEGPARPVEGFCGNRRKVGEERARNCGLWFRGPGAERGGCAFAQPPSCRTRMAFALPTRRRSREISGPPPGGIGARKMGPLKPSPDVRRTSGCPLSGLRGAWILPGSAAPCP